MSRDQHLRADHYVLAREGKIGPGSVAVRLHQHLVRICAECQSGWEQVAQDQEAVRQLLVEGSSREEGPAPPPRPHRPAFSREARRLEEEVERLREVRSAACRNGWELLQQEPEERLRRIDAARLRYRSRAEAEYLLEKAREVIRDNPRESGRRAALASRILERMGAAADEPWGAALAARAAAWQGNALRVAGDLPAADRVFALVRREIAAATIEDAGAIADVASLEASLRIDQRRIPEAHELLDLAAIVYRTRGNGEGAVKVLIKQASLFTTEGNPAAALDRLEEAAAGLARIADNPYLRFCIVNERVLNLCELERYEQADRLLDEHLDVYEDSDQLHAGALLRHLRGRIALGKGQLHEAAEALRDAGEAFLAADRAYDATITSLDLAAVFAEANQHRELAALAGRLLQLFRAQGVPRETMAALHLLVRAARAETATRPMVERLRKRFLSP